MNSTKHFIVYRTLNLLSGEFYFGVHCQIEDDDYLGSGIRIVRQVEKYGRSSFLRETLSVWRTEAEAFEEERRILEDWLGHPLCLNISSGGDGGANFKGRTHSDETRKILSEKASKRTLSPETRAKVAEANRNRSAEAKAKFALSAKETSAEKRAEINAKISHSLRGRTSSLHSQDTKDKISESAKKRFEDPLERSKISEAMKASWSQEDRTAWGETQRNKWTPEMREKASRQSKGRAPWNKKLKCGHIIRDKCSCDMITTK